MRKKTKIISSLVFATFLSLFFLINFVSASDSSSNVEYGLLYNWYAADDSRGLCPEGWHVPSYTEFQTFHDYLEPVSYFYMDYKIKEIGTDHWESPNEDATDETGFSALGGGMRTYTGLFIELKQRADFISSTSFSEVYPEQNRSYDAFEVYLSSYSSGDIWVGANRKKAGSSVRCIRDTNDGWVEGEQVTDYDKNVYETVQIGTQVWLKQNLAVTHYNNGDAIPEVTDNASWAALTTGALCAYDNNWGYVFQFAGKPLFSCGTLSESGETYVLTKDVTSTGTCFTITAPNITLDCQGNWITYSTEGLANNYGIYTNQNYVNIKNCNIFDGNFASSQYTRQGIYFDSADNSKVSNSFINTSRSSGIYLYNGASFNELNSNKVVADFYTGEAIRVEKSSDNILTNNIVEGKGGIYILESPNNVLTNNVGTALQSGIGTYYSPNSILINNTGKSYDPKGIDGYVAGIRIYESPNSVLTSNTGITTNSRSFGNPYGGITLYRSSNTNLTDNIGICEHGGINVGILFEYSSNHLLIDNTGISVDGNGIYLLGSSNITLIDSTATGGNYGVLLERSSNNLFKDCNIQGTTGVYLNGSSVYSTNNTFLNCSYDTEVVNGDGNELIRKWYYQAQVKDSSNNPLFGASVSALNNLGVEQFSELTDSSGWIERQEVIDYVNLGGTKTYYSDYNISAKKEGYNLETHIIDFTSQNNKVDDLFVLNEKISDIIPPKIVIYSPLNNKIYRRPVIFKVLAMDDSGINSCVYSLDSKENVTMTNTFGNYWTSINYSIPKGCHTVVFSCTDNSGLVSFKQSYFRVR